jgi:hypothetical protein
VNDKFEQQYNILIHGFEKHYRFGLTSKYMWPYSIDDAVDLVSIAYQLNRFTSQEIICYVKEMVEVDEEEFCVYRLTPEGFRPKPTNLVDQVVYNEDTLIIKHWSAGLIITSATFHLVRSGLGIWKRGYDAVFSIEQFNAEPGYCPACFFSPVCWGYLLQLSVNPYIGPELSLALKDISSVRNHDITLEITSILIKYNYLFMPKDKSFLKEGLTNYLAIFHLDDIAIFKLAEKVYTSNSFDALTVFLTNYKSSIEKA